MFFCWFGGVTWSMAVAAIPIIFLIFNYISIVVDDLVACGIIRISDNLKLSPAMAALTLIALANGASDVITAIISAGTEGGINYNIGGLYGAGLFIGGLVMPMCIIWSKTGWAHYGMDMIIRDILIYAISIPMMMLFAYDGEIQWYEALLMILVYIFMVIGTWIYDCKVRADILGNRKLNVIDDLTDQTKLDDILEQIEFKYMNDSDHENATRENTEPQQEEERLINDDEQRMIGNINDMIKKITPLARKCTNDSSDSTKKEMENSWNDQDKDSVRLLTSFQLFSYINTHKRTKQQFKNDQTKKQQDALKSEDTVTSEGKETKLTFTECFKFWFFKIIDTPFKWVLYLTSPPVVEEEWDKTRALCAAFFAPFAVIFYVGKTLDWQPYVYVSLPIAVLQLLNQAFATKHNEIPKCFWTNTVVATIMGVIYNYVIAGVLVDFLDCFGMIYNLEKTFLGLTFLAIGNAFPDAQTTLYMVKQGNTHMAIAGSYCGQLFGLTLGFGVSQLKQTIVAGPQKFKLFDTHNIVNQSLLLSVLICTFVVFLITFLWGQICYLKKKNAGSNVKLNEYDNNMNRKFSYIVMTIYTVFIVGTTAQAQYKAITTF